MSSSLYCLLHKCTFVKAGIIHDNNAVGWQLRNQIMGHPVSEYLRIHICLKQEAFWQGGLQMISGFIDELEGLC